MKKKLYIIVPLTLTLAGCGILDGLLLPEANDPDKPMILKHLQSLITTASNATTYGGIAIGALTSIWIAIRGRRAYIKRKNGKNGNNIVDTK